MEMSKPMKQLVEDYTPDQAGIETVRATRIVMLCGIISAGKGALHSKLLESSLYHLITSNTTRLPRENNGIMERNGIEYYFTSQDDMRELIENHKMVEVNQFGENIYGTSVEEFKKVANQHKTALGDIDINGLINLRRIADDSITAIFIVPPDYATWRSRFVNRYGSSEAIEKEWAYRRDITIDELERALAIPYLHFLINDEIDRAAKAIDKLARHEKDEPSSGDERAREVALHLLEEIKAS